jgi:hypothetical protein
MSQTLVKRRIETLRLEIAKALETESISDSSLSFVYAMFGQEISFFVAQGIREKYASGQLYNIPQSSRHAFLRELDQYIVTDHGHGGVVV